MDYYARKQREQRKLERNQLIKYIKEDGKYEDGEYLAGYTGLTTQEDAEFLARAFIAGYQLGKKSNV